MFHGVDWPARRSPTSVRRPWSWTSGKAPAQEAKDTIDATPAAVMLGMVLSKEQLFELKRKAIEAHQAPPRLRVDAYVPVSEFGRSRAIRARSAPRPFPE